MVANDCLLVFLKWRKTNQESKKDIKIPIMAVPGSSLCPVATYRAAVEAVKVEPSGPAFVAKRGRNAAPPVPLTYSQLQEDMRLFLNKAGYHSQLFSSHSMRRGGATFAFNSGMPGG